EVPRPMTANVIFRVEDVAIVIGVIDRGSKVRIAADVQKTARFDGGELVDGGVGDLVIRRHARPTVNSHQKDRAGGGDSIQLSQPCELIRLRQVRENRNAEEQVK